MVLGSFVCSRPKLGSNAMADLTISPENDSLKEPELVSINTPTPLSHQPRQKSTPTFTLYCHRQLPTSL